MKNYNKIVSIDEYLIREVLKENESSIIRFVELASPYYLWDSEFQLVYYQ